MQFKNRLRREYTEMLERSKASGRFEDDLGRLVVCKEIVDAFPEDKDLTRGVVMELRKVPDNANLLDFIYQYGYLKSPIDIGDIIVNASLGQLV